jgi:S-adenosylmethionine:tRNA ribosyltransferase-isomerase
VKKSISSHNDEESVQNSAIIIHEKRLISVNIMNIPTHDYNYFLPEERVAAYPLAERDASKLLIADVRSEQFRMRHSVFRHLAEEVPANALLVMNDSRVIAARILMHKASGGQAEILCLHPIASSPEHKPDYSRALQATGAVQWLCMVGGRKIHVGDVLTLNFTVNAETPPHSLTLNAEILAKDGAEAEVKFTWTPDNISFAECLEACGHVPLPPYIKRDDEASDKERYQTVYAAHDGSVAAPTAGLHFTERVLADLRAKGIREERVTLHVGAGTFKPMSSDNAAEHIMHYERIFVDSSTITTLVEQLQAHEQTHFAPIIAVGTTSIRTLESLYWWGVLLITGQMGASEATELDIRQWDGFQFAEQADKLPLASEVFQAIAHWMKQHNLDTLTGETQIMIAPGYTFRVCDGLITNFHQPESTLMLLVAAFLDDGNTSHWKTVYNEALERDYRFLSYGDSSLLWRK